MFSCSIITNQVPNMMSSQNKITKIKTAESCKERLDNYLLKEAFRKDKGEDIITIEEALTFEIEYINHKNNKINSIQQQQVKKKISTLI